MVAISDLKVYQSVARLGGAMSATQVVSATPNNVFLNVPKNELVTGEDYYACIYFKNAHATESMDNFKLWLSSKTPPGDTILKWGFDMPITGSYKYSPYFEGDGATTFDSTVDDPDLRLSEWTVAAWFRTSVTNTTQMMIVNKGGSGSDTAGQNDNYSLSMTTSQKIQAGFEEADGTNHYATSNSTYNDGNWHFALAFYNGSRVELYIDDMSENVDEHDTSAAPEENAHPLVVGRNSRSSANFWDGDIDEVRVWNIPLQDFDDRQAILNGTINISGMVYENKFGADDNEIEAQVIADKYTAPLNITWTSLSAQPSTPNYGKLKPQTAFPIWLWLHVNANADARIDDAGVFTFKFNIPPGGTGSGGSGTDGGGSGGTGGNPPPVIPNYKIAIAGDWGVEPETDDVIDLIQDEDYDYVVGTGDNAYEPADDWVEKFDVLLPNFNSVYGNHEYSESGGTSPYKNFFGHSKTYFTFKFENIQFFMIDTNIDLDDGSTQHTFFENALAASQNDNTVVWRIAIMHHPMYGANSNHDPNEFDQRQAFHRLFQNNGVNFVVTGHNHFWERTAQLSYNSNNHSNPGVVDSSSPYSRSAVGFIHVISGAGGHDSGSSLYDFDSDPSYDEFQNNNKNGVWEIIATNSGNTLTCSFVDTGGSKFDTFVINA